MAEFPKTVGASDYKFDVAFSFLKNDEGLAVRLGDLVQDRLRTFIYSKKQEDLAGRDGEETFSGVFGRDARLVVILYREAWGSTSWTRIERDAIRNRAFDKGYDFTLWIPLDKPPRTPDYVPKTRLWGDIDTFGENGIAAVIVKQAIELGAAAQPETLEQKTARYKRAADAEERRQRFHGPSDGVMRARAEAGAIVAQVGKWAEAARTQFSLEVKALGQQGLMVICRDDGRRRATTLVLGWRQPITNSTQDSELDVQIYDGIPPGPGYFTFEEARLLSRHKFYSDLSPGDEVIWRKTRMAGDAMSAGAVSDFAVENYLKALAR